MKMKTFIVFDAL